jgi:hypothetical protein
MIPNINNLMNKNHLATSSCRLCRYYLPEGRRGGMCQKLSVPVESNWKACFLASLPFSNSWESLEEIIHLEHSFALKCSSTCLSSAQAQPPKQIHPQKTTTA